MRLREVLSLPSAYRAFQAAVTGPRFERGFVESLGVERGEAVLDIGCEPGDLLARLPQVSYVGFDVSESYISSAKARYGDGGTFHCASVMDPPSLEGQAFDLVIARGVLHHLNDTEAHALFRFASNALRVGGRLVTVDGCFVAGQSRAARFLLNHDRGEFVRSRDPRNACYSRRMERVNVHEKLALISDHWNPRIVGELNGQHVKLVKFQGEFVWHDHEGEDELFMVLRGSFRMDFRDRSVTLNAGDFLIVPRGVEHRPVADEEVEVMLFEPALIKHTGDVESVLTVHEFERL